SRHRCFFGGASPYTNSPPDLVDICAYSNLGFVSAYKELQPTLIWQNVNNMADPSVTDAEGRSICGSIMWMTAPEGAEARRVRAKERGAKRNSNGKSYKNTLRPTVRYGPSEPLLATLPLVGAVSTNKYERDCQVVFVEDGIEMLVTANLEAVRAPGWPSFAELTREFESESMRAFACAG